MIKRLNENELFNVVVSHGIKLERHNEGFLKRIGIAMYSEDGTNFLQGVAALDFYKTKNENIHGKIRNIWCAPECNIIEFKTSLNYNIIEYGKSEALKYGNEISVKNDIITVKINLTNNNNNSNNKNSSSNSNNNSYNNKNTKNDKNTYVKEAIDTKKKENKEIKNKKVKNNKEINSNKESTNNINNNNSNSNNSNNNNKELIKDINNETSNYEIISEDKLNSFISDINDSFAELPAKKKGSEEVFGITNESGFIAIERYAIENATVYKFMNVYIKPDMRRNKNATNLMTYAVDYINKIKNNEQSNIILCVCVGQNKEIVEKIVKKIDGFIFNGPVRGKIPYEKEI